MAKLALGHRREASEPDCIRAVLAEVVLTFLFVFAGVGTAMTAGKMVGGADSIMGLSAVALAHAFVVAVMISAGLHISGGHLNPAVTLGLAVGGNITLFRSLLYVIAQLLGSSLACLLLKYLTGGLYTIAMLGYGPEDQNTVLELTYNYGVKEYDKGNAYAQIAIGTDDVYKTAEAIKLFGGKITREPGPLPGINTKITACLDPDGWKSVFVDNKDFAKELE